MTRSFRYSKARVRPARNWQYPYISSSVQFYNVPGTACGHNVNFGIWFPDGYDPNNSVRTYPVLYILHGVTSSPNSVSSVISFVQAAIAAGDFPECIVVFPNSGTDGWWTDNCSGAYLSSSRLAETSFIRDLIPHVDRHTRSKGTARSRMLMGFSMGCFGAMKFTAKYHKKLFCATVGIAGPRMDATFGTGWNSDPAAYAAVMCSSDVKTSANSAAQIFEANASVILDEGYPIRLIKSSTGDNGTASSVTNLQGVLDDLEITYEIVDQITTPHVFSTYLTVDDGASFRFLRDRVSLS